MPTTEINRIIGEQDVSDCDTSNAKVGQDEYSIIFPRECINLSIVHGEVFVFVDWGCDWGTHQGT